LEPAWTRDIAVFGDVPDQQDRDIRGLGQGSKGGGNRAGLGYTAGNTFDPGGVHGLDGVHDNQRRFELFHMPKDNVEVRLSCQIQSVMQSIRALSAGADLAYGFLCGDIKGGAWVL